jgi:rubrerythrin
MSTPFAQSQTRINLLRSFAGESQARNRYTMAAEVAKKNKLEVIQSVFLFTADQERAHAQVFYDLLASESGQNITIDGSYPIDHFDNNVLQYLRAAQHNEYQEHEVDYAGFAGVAGEEGFERIAHIFHMIAGIEKTHGDRFGHLADLLEQNQLFVSQVETGWMCLNCGQIVHATMAPALCPVCQHGQGYFIRLEMAPFACGACNQG